MELDNLVTLSEKEAARLEEHVQSLSSSAQLSYINANIYKSKALQSIATIAAQQGLATPGTSAFSLVLLGIIVGFGIGRSFERAEADSRELENLLKAA